MCDFFSLSLVHSIGGRNNQQHRAACPNEQPFAIQRHTRRKRLADVIHFICVDSFWSKTSGKYEELSWGFYDSIKVFSPSAMKGGDFEWKWMQRKLAASICWFDSQTWKNFIIKPFFASHFSFQFICFYPHFNTTHSQYYEWSPSEHFNSLN